ncbi:FAD-binding oxidoreductase [Streptomyces sp. NPDC026673]|uniref:FAD-binding oxidoreductase n=1 Tax=Streptomyces sp. NPDC026673 TaxID=3155724 RepID=UPI0033F05013
MNRRTLIQSGVGIAAAGWLTAACGPKGGGTGAAGGRTPDGPGSGATTSGAASPATSAPASPNARPDWKALGRSLDGRLVLPDDADYATARLLYNTRYDGQRPAAVAYVSGTGDIREALDFARRTGVPVSIRNGGHSYAGYSGGKGRLVLDVSSLAAVNVSGGTATIGAGAKLIDVYTKLGARGRTLSAGSCPTVGISGLTLGGGHGVLSRAYGLTCDSLTGAEIVTAGGRVLHCSASENPELFWALRGAGGGQFGVVTNLTFATHASPQVVTGYLTWPWSKAAAVLRAWQEWGPTQPDEIWSALHLDKSGTGSPRISIATVGITSRDELANAVDRLADRVGAPASTVSLHPRTYLDAALAYAGCSNLSTAQCHLPGNTPGRSPSGRLGRETYTARSDFYDRSLSAAGIQTLLSQVEGVRSGSGSVSLTALGGAVNRVSPTATAFVHRRSRFLAQYIEAPGTTSWLSGLHTAMRRHASGAAYQNYTDPTLGDWRTAYYGSAADKLTRLKARYDPSRLFAFAQAL